MRVLNLKITLRASWVHSLKEKRMVVKSIVQRLKNKFNVSVGEVHEQDIHQIKSLAKRIIHIYHLIISFQVI